MSRWAAANICKPLLPIPITGHHPRGNGRGISAYRFSDRTSSKKSFHCGVNLQPSYSTPTGNKPSSLHCSTSSRRGSWLSQIIATPLHHRTKNSPSPPWGSRNGPPSLRRRPSSTLPPTPTCIQLVPHQPRILNTHLCRSPSPALYQAFTTLSGRFSKFTPYTNNGTPLGQSQRRALIVPPDRCTRSKYKRLLFLCKRNDERVQRTLETLIAYLAKQHPEVCPILEEDLCEEEEEDGGREGEECVGSTGRRRMRREQIDLVVALGGDGTVLHVSHLFERIPCPPILGFNFGTIGFLLHFAPSDKFQVMDQVLNGQLRVERRMRLNCFVGNNHPGSHTQNHPGPVDDGPTSSLVDLSALNEVSLHRTGCPHMVAVNIHVEGRFLTQAVADGLIVATPTGSTAYSCSAGGPIVCPTMQAILLTPICPRSLSFRPLILPPTLSVQLSLDPRSRSTAELRVDGICIQPIRPGESVEIRASHHPIHLFSPTPNLPTTTTHHPAQPTLNHNAFHDHWIDDLNLMLNFNCSYQPKDPHHHLHPSPPTTTTTT